MSCGLWVGLACGVTRQLATIVWHTSRAVCGLAWLGRYAENALARLGNGHGDNQLQIAKHSVALLGQNQNTGAQTRAALVLRDLAAANPGSPVVIVNAGAISPV